MTKKEEEEENVSIVKQLYDAFRRRDISSVLDMFGDDAIAQGPAPAVCSRGAVFTMVEGELQNSLKLLANHLNPGSLSSTSS